MYAVEVRDRIMIAHSLPDPFFGPAQHMHGATFVVDVAFFRETLTRENVVVDIGAALEVLGMGGRCAVVGIGDRALTIAEPARFVRRALQVSAVYGYSTEDIGQVSRLLIDGTLDLAASVSVVLPLDEVNVGIRRLSEPGASLVRVVIDPTASAQVRPQS